VLEPVTGAAADEQHILQTRVEIDQKVAVRAILILADLGVGQHGAAQCGEAAVAEGDDLVQGSIAPAPVLSVGIDFGAMQVVGELRIGPYLLPAPPMSPKRKPRHKRT